MSPIASGDHSRWMAVEKTFMSALQQPAARRSEWARANIDDVEVRAEVVGMLAAHERVTGVLDRAPALPPDDMRPLVESALGDRYTVTRLLGRGGMATVYLARELKHDRDVVLKVLHPDVAAHVGMNRFSGEVRIAAQLAHPHILPLIDSGEARGLLYYVMPRLEGETLRDRLAKGGRPSVAEVINLLRDIADALSAAHAHGIIHRDLKPENVLCAGDHAYLLDFGIARKEVVAADDARHTQEGMVVGTVGYMSPEQSAGVALDARSDLFAWGVIAREMLTGAAPLETTADFGRAPAPLVQLVSQTLEEQREHRPRSAREIVDRLDAMSRVSLRVARVGRVRASQGAAIAAVVIAAVWGVAQYWSAGTANDAMPQPIAVAPLTNETGDTSLAIWGRMAGDWLTQGLHETSLVQVVPFPSVRHASDELAQASPGLAVAPTALAGEVNAGVIVSGAYYLAGDKVGFRLDVTDTRRNRLIASLPAIEVPRDSLQLAVREARDRLMGWVALRLDARAASLPGISGHPPTFEAYRAFDRGLASYNAQEYAPAAAEFRYAWQADTTFVPALIYAAMSHWNRDEYDWVDTLVTMAAARRERLSAHDQLQLDYLAALMASDGERAVAAGRRAVAIAPESRTAYNLGRDLVAMNRPVEGRAVLEAIHPDRGLMKGWPSYWTQLTHARHLTGAHVEELEAARSMRRLFPDARVATVLEARALAVLGRTAELDSLLTATAAMPARVYWSHAAALVVSGDEMLAHGDTLAGRRNLERAVEWLQSELRAEPGLREHRYWLGTSLYNLARWREAAAVFVRLHRDFPDRPQYAGLDALGRARLGDHAGALSVLGPPPAAARGEHTTFRARLAAIAGDTTAARALRLQSLREVSSGFAWLHATALRDLDR